jgi:hypothetical protein
MPTHNPTGGSERSEELTRVAAEIAARLSRYGVLLNGRETPLELANIEEAISLFESAVQSRGGDLMVDEGVRGAAAQPDNKAFALPLRSGHESVAQYLEHLARATDTVRQQPAKS